MTQLGSGMNERIEHKNNDIHCGYWYHASPVFDDQADRNNLKGHESSLKDEKVVSGGYTECFIDIAAGKSNERGGNGKVSNHLCEA